MNKGGGGGQNSGILSERSFWMSPCCSCEKFHTDERQKQPSIGVLIKRFSENMQWISGEHPCQSMISIKFHIEITLILIIFTFSDNFLEYSKFLNKSVIEFYHYLMTSSWVWLAFYTVWKVSVFGVILILIFLRSNKLSTESTPYLSVFSRNAGKYRPE